ncbi:MAG: glycosyltransferase family 2 protein [Hungatella sp.]
MEAIKQMVDVVIPTYHPDQKFITLIHRLQQQSHPIHKIIIMNTEESVWKTAGMEEIENLPEVELHHVPQEEFDHGATRDLGIRYSKAPIVICMTQDAMPKHDSLAAQLLEGLKLPGVAVAYGRQLPTSDCDALECYTRSFNYPAGDQVKTQADLPKLGIKTFFSSNVCAAYRKDIYLQLGGFIHKTIFNEDMIFAAGAIDAGYGVAYCGKAEVVHAHHYTAMQQFRRNFDLAVSQADHPEVFARVSSEREGIRLVKQNMAYLCRVKKPNLIPKLVGISACKYVGYRMGKQYQKLPMWLVKGCTMNQNYWK